MLNHSVGDAAVSRGESHQATIARGDPHHHPYPPTTAAAACPAATAAAAYRRAPESFLAARDFASPAKGILHIKAHTEFRQVGLTNDKLRHALGAWQLR